MVEKERICNCVGCDEELRGIGIDTETLIAWTQGRCYYCNEYCRVGQPCTAE